MTEKEQFLSVLFTASDNICTGNRYATRVKSIDYTEDAEFFSINPLNPNTDFGNKSDKGRRADINVTTYRNFLFEMDSVPLKDQNKIMMELGCFSTIVYSGGKSLHGIISLEKPLDLLPYNLESTTRYGKTWKMLSGYLDSQIVKMGYVRPAGKDSFFDPACKNASRLSRFPNHYRQDKGRMQEVLFIGTKLPPEEFKNMLDKAPKIYRSVIESHEEYVDPPLNEKQFFVRAGTGLSDLIKHSYRWAASEGVYPDMYRICTWAIDRTNVTKELLLEIFEKNVYPELRIKGYPEHKLNNAIDHAYRRKRTN